VGAKLVEKFGAEKVTDFVVKDAFYYIQKEAVRALILDHGKRLDGRGFDAIREISSEVGILPRAHGSALFRRGETQAVTLATLGTGDDVQEFDSYTGGENEKKFLLHYNFPNFSVGETGRISGPGRREIGHGRWRSGRLNRCCRSTLILTPCASRARSWSRTVRPRWRVFAAARWRCSMQAFR
jgi:polyribonucleotide nucleotidyltransferase